MCRITRALHECGDDVQGGHGDQSLNLVDFTFEVLQYCPSSIRQTVEQPNRSQQILVADHHGHLVVCIH